MIRVSIYDDNHSLRDTLALLIDATDDMLSKGLYDNAMRVVDNVREDMPDVILMDIDMPGRTGIEAVKLLRQTSYQPKILMLTVFEEPDRIFAAISNGAVGYLLKKTPADEIIDAIRTVMNGGAAMTPTVALKVLASFQQPKPVKLELTDKEQAVLRRLVEGDSYKLIAYHCDISMGTVRTHICNIYEKLHVNSKSEAVAKALKTGLFG
ncbi:response regulator transcription factor [Arsenicibacter rosenii]|uniref:DNA-binding response regulator n=1 Tax=Arsenicibacter rosenii TaxID=1750698 RepID=A0A1S2VMB1_9BACT|nr:response regulator transcription factor [Arsenicibacter rosenii]OIN59336.1 DNA-binding response regulator [Arsenicibacter rosenii]